MDSLYYYTIRVCFFSKFFIYSLVCRSIRRIDLHYIIENPIKTEIQSDGRIKKWAKIEAEGKYLRVILLEDEETVHNAFFDRSFKEV